MKKFFRYLHNVETSKKALWITCLLFMLTLVTGIVYTYMDKDTSFFMYSIPSTGGVFGATIIFYLNKAKMENIFKGREAFLKYKLDLLKEQPPELHSVIEEELDSIDNILCQSIDSETQDILNEKINNNPIT